MEKMTNVKAINYVVENFGADLPADVAEKLAKIKASFEKKSENRKPTATQKENEVVKETILAVLEEAKGGLTVTEIQAKDETLGAASNQKVSALLRMMIAEGTVDKAKDKRATVFFAV